MQLLVLQALTYTLLSLLIGVLYSVVSISTDSQRKVSATSLSRDVDNSRKPGKLPGCERDFSGCKALLLSPRCF